MASLSPGLSGAATRRILNVRVAPIESDAMMHMGPSIVSRSAPSTVCILMIQIFLVAMFATTHSAD